jgi:hypothetical protein
LGFIQAVDIKALNQRDLGGMCWHSRAILRPGPPGYYLHHTEILVMSGDLIRQAIIANLIKVYEANPETFTTLPKETLDSSWARIVISDLRNAGVLEEQVRGVVRLTSRGYHAHKQPDVLRLQQLQLRTAV